MSREQQNPITDFQQHGFALGTLKVGCAHPLRIPQPRGSPGPAAGGCHGPAGLRGRWERPRRRWGSAPGSANPCGGRVWEERLGKQAARPPGAGAECVGPPGAPARGLTLCTPLPGAGICSARCNFPARWTAWTVGASSPHLTCSPTR